MDDAGRIRSALALYHDGELSRAQMLLETLDPDHLDPALRVEAVYLLGLVYTKRGDALGATQCFSKCSRLDRSFFPALDAWGNLLQSLGDTFGAIDKYRRALAVAKPDQAVHALLNYGQALQRAGMDARALRKFRECYNRCPDSDSAYLAGVCFLQMQRAKGAVKWMQRALDRDPMSARNHTGMGNALSLAGKSDDAIAHFQLAIDRDPMCADAYYNWARVLARRGNLARAVHRCKQGLRQCPDGFELLAQQAYCLRRMGAYDAVLQAARRARQLMLETSREGRKPHFFDALTVNEAASLRALGRAQQARSRLIEHLRNARDPSPESLAELRHQDARRIQDASKFELTLNVKLLDHHRHSVMPYRRVYWVVAGSMKQARRMARELEPGEAEVRFESQEVQDSLATADQGVIARSPAMPL